MTLITPELALIEEFTQVGRGNALEGVLVYTR